MRNGGGDGCRAASRSTIRRNCITQAGKASSSDALTELDAVTTSPAMTSPRWKPGRNSEGPFGAENGAELQGSEGHLVKPFTPS